MAYSYGPGQIVQTQSIQPVANGYAVNVPSRAVYAPQAYVAQPSSIMLQMPKNGFHAYSPTMRAPEQNRDTIERINKALASRVNFKARLFALWVPASGIHRGIADAEALQGYLGKVARDLDVPVRIFGNPETNLDIYDFNGDGRVQFHEAYRLVKHALAAYRKELGGKFVVDVPFKTPLECGYTVVKVLGKGAQGVASLAVDRNGVQRVLKSYAKDNTNAGGIDDIQEELETTSKIDSCAHVAKTYDIFQDDTSFYLIMDPFMGGDLETLQEKAIGSGVDLNEAWYRRVFYQFFSALEWLHTHGITHCDIKEPNLMVKTTDYQNPYIVVIDYGLSASTLVSKGIRGTPGYIPPETWRRGCWYPKGDVFSMGVVCCQMLCDRVPSGKYGIMGIFQETPTIDGIIINTETKEPPYSSMNPYSDDILDWLQGCLAKDIHERSKVAEVLGHPWFDGETPVCGHRAACNIS
eukprot:TRINITY_DN75019_c0_g1_i1.p1 TRINITY_DN75019_c0_g1~~TRINITY_DN75019_c0_g1_i1.p1  ORF type:complete len:466 (-),score=57.67 TRINITY_DN75019_c0_g1_i1:86-1483(-)